LTVGSAEVSAAGNPISTLHRTFNEDGESAQGEKVELMEDAALLEAVAQGNQDAMAAVFDRYSRIVYCIALRVLHDPSLAEDVMQEVLLQVWKRPQSFVAQRGNLSAWLSVVARNRAIDVLRKRSQMDPLGELPLPDPHDMAHESEQGWLLERIRTVLDSLPTDQQASLELAYFQGLSHTEIAAKTGSPLGTVKTRIRAGLMSLRKAMTA
jgi:RNA polymerase sigma-70 factor (ECF subfamily)